MATEAQLQRKGAWNTPPDQQPPAPKPDHQPHFPSPKELERLLLTAKDKERQEMLRKAIASLDETSAAAAQVVHPSFRSTLMEESVRLWCCVLVSLMRWQCSDAPFHRYMADVQRGRRSLAFRGRQGHAAIERAAPPPPVLWPACPRPRGASIPAWPFFST